MPSFLAGPFTTPIGTEGNAWFPSKSGDPAWPDIQLAFISSTPAVDFGLRTREGFGFKKEVRQEMLPYEE